MITLTLIDLNKDESTKVINISTSSIPYGRKSLFQARQRGRGERRRGWELVIEAHMARIDSKLM